MNSKHKYTKDEDLASLAERKLEKAKIERDDWDFSDLKETHFRDALSYERMRSCPKIRSALLLILNMSFQGITFRERASQFMLKQPVAPYSESQITMIKTPLGVTAFQNPDFPKPWIMCQNIRTEIIDNIKWPNDPKYVLDAATVHKIGDQALMNLFRSDESKVAIIRISTSGRPHKKDFMEEIEAWFERESRECQRSDDNFLTELKDLAAFRLRQAKLTYNEAMAFLEKEKKRKDPRGIWPFFGEAPWYRAVSRANKEILNLEEFFASDVSEIEAYVYASKS